MVRFPSTDSRGVPNDTRAADSIDRSELPLLLLQAKEALNQKEKELQEAKTEIKTLKGKLKDAEDDIKRRIDSQAALQLLRNQLNDSSELWAARVQEDASRILNLRHEADQLHAEKEKLLLDLHTAQVQRQVLEELLVGQRHTSNPHPHPGFSSPPRTGELPSGTVPDWLKWKAYVQNLTYQAIDKVSEQLTLQQKVSNQLQEDIATLRLQNNIQRRLLMIYQRHLPAEPTEAPKKKEEDASKASRPAAPQLGSSVLQPPLDTEDIANAVQKLVLECTELRNRVASTEALALTFQKERDEAIHANRALSKQLSDPHALGAQESPSKKRTKGQLTHNGGAHLTHEGVQGSGVLFELLSLVEGFSTMALGCRQCGHCFGLDVGYDVMAASLQLHRDDFRELALQQVGLALAEPSPFPRSVASIGDRGTRRNSAENVLLHLGPEDALWVFREAPFTNELTCYELAKFYLLHAARCPPVDDAFDIVLDEVRFLWLPWDLLNKEINEADAILQQFGTSLGEVSRNWLYAQKVLPRLQQASRVKALFLPLLTGGSMMTATAAVLGLSEPVREELYRMRSSYPWITVGDELAGGRHRQSIPVEELCRQQLQLMQPALQHSI